MPGFKITTFKGTAPKISPRLLAEDFGQIAKNCFLGTGDLVPYKATTDDWTVSKTGTMQSLYKFEPGAANPDAGAPISAGYWFHWTQVVDVVKSPIQNDTWARTYFTGATSEPRVTSNVLALAGATTQYPALSYKLGVPAPTATPVIDPALGMGGTPTSSDPLDAEDRYYVYTFVDSFGGESAPSAVSAKITTFPGELPNIKMTDSTGGWAAADISLTYKRLYVTATSSTATDFQFCKQVTVATLVAQDDGTRAEVLPTKTWAIPDAGMIGIVAMSNGIVVGFKGNTLMFSEPYAPYAYPVEYQLGVDFDIVGLGVAGDQLVVCTEGNPYLAGGATSSAMALTKIDIEQACVSKRSIVSILNGVVYASPDGLVYIDSSGPQLITSELMTRDQWQAFKPSTIHGYQHDNLYYGFYNNGTTSAGFILDPTNRHFIEIDTYATAGYNDLLDDALYLVVGNKVKKWDSGSSNLTYTWKTKEFVTPKPTNFNVAQVIAASYPITFKLNVDGVTKHTQTVADSNGFRLPAGFLGRSWNVEISGTNVVEAVYVADSMGSLGEVV